MSLGDKINHCKQIDNNSDCADLPLIVKEMSEAGLNILPYIEMAARDILHRYQGDALYVSDQILEKMTECEDDWGVFVWGKIRTSLNALNECCQFIN